MIRHLLFLLPSTCLLLFGQAGPGSVITTSVGTDWLFPANGRRAVDAPLGGALGGLGVAVDSQGNYYIADADNNMVMRVDSGGTLRVVAGNGVDAHSGDGGSATAAAVGAVRAVAVDRAGDLYVVSSRSRIRKINSRTGVITTIAGNGVRGYDGDNKPATSAALNDPQDVAVDSAGIIYVADTLNHRIRKIGLDGTITTVAGTGQPGDGGDNIAATSAALNQPAGVALDNLGNLYIADLENRRVRKVTTGGIISSVVIDVAPSSIEVDSAGALYLSDPASHGVFKVVNGAINLIAGTGLPGFSGDGGPALSARLSSPQSIAVDSAFNVYIGDRGNSRIRRVTPSGTINTVAGNGQFRSSGDGGPATSATLYLPRGSTADPSGNLYISEPYRNRVRRVSGGIVTTYAGTGRAGYSGDGGAAAQADLSFPTGLVFDSQTNSLLIVDQGNNRIRRVGSDGIITTVAGNGQAGAGADNIPAVESSLNAPEGIAIGGGNIYIADTGNHKIRAVESSGRIRTIAGTGTKGRSDENIPATRAALDTPRGVVLDKQGVIFLTDTGNNRIRKIDASGNITTVVGTSSPGNSGDNGPAVAATLSAPSGMAFTPDGDLFFADENNNRIRCYVITGGYIIVSVAGNGQPGFSGDGGLAPNATLRAPTSLVIDPAGNALISDAGNHRIRQLRASPPSFAVQPTELTFTGNSGAAPAPVQTIRLFSGVPNVPFTATVETESGGNWLSVNPTSGAMSTTVEVTANPETLSARTFRGLVRFSAPLAVPPEIEVHVEFQVGPALPAKIVPQPLNLTFSYTQGSTTATTQPLTLTNAGSGSVNLTVTASTTSGGNWLSATPSSASVAASAQGVPITVRANPTGLRAGTYLGQIALASTGANIQVNVPLVMTVNPAPVRLVVSPVGITFIGVQNGGALPPQAFTILNTGSGNLSWRTRVTDVSGGTPWLTLGSDSGSTTGGSAGSRVEVRANASGLPPGEYYGQIEITSPEAVNSPQFVSVFLGILAAGTDPGPVVQPSGLVFRNSQVGSPGSQEIVVSNLSSRPITFRSARAFVGGREWFVHLPSDATVTSDQPARIVVQPRTDGLPSGVYQGSLTFLFADNTTRTVDLVLVNTPPGSSSAFGAKAADGCVPKKLLPVVTSVGLQSAVLAGWPNPLIAEVIDDCGNPLMDGSVVSEFSNSDPPVLMTSSNDGKWSGIWQIRSTNASQVGVRVKAAKPDMNIEGTAEVTAALRQSGEVPPVVAAGGILSAASFLARPPAPGSFITIFGARLADQFAVSSKIPFETELASTSVSIAGRRMPLYFTADGQINAIIPYGVATNTTQQLVVKRGSRIGTPEPITVASAQPAVFTSDQSGKGQGAVLDVQGRLVAAANPAKAGDGIQIFCEGLGSVNPPVAAGSAAPAAEPFARATETVSVTIGGRPATLLFAGLAPGFAGLYQVNAIVPAGLTPGNVNVVIKVGDQESPPVTIAVQ